MACPRGVAPVNEFHDSELRGLAGELFSTPTVARSCMKDEASHQPYFAFAVFVKCERRDCGCRAAVLNPADSPLSSGE